MGMRKLCAVLGLAAALAAPAFPVPDGLAGPSVGFGGILGDQGFVGGELDFGAPPSFSWGPEAMLAFGGGVGILGGVAGRFYIIPNYDYLVQPYLPFGGGGFVYFTNDGDDTPHDPGGGTETTGGGYLHFGGGTDFDIPETPIVPYIDLGALVYISGDTSAAFKIEIGVRFGK